MSTAERGLAVKFSTAVRGATLQCIPEICWYLAGLGS